MTQYLILHKVRGEPSFDCAEEIEPDMWITNSGYRAYPVQKWDLATLASKWNMDTIPIPEDWPDHFEVRGEKTCATIDIGALFERLIPKIRRRI